MTNEHTRHIFSAVNGIGSDIDSTNDGSSNTTPEAETGSPRAGEPLAPNAIVSAEELRELQAPMVGVSLSNLTTNAFVNHSFLPALEPRVDVSVLCRELPPQQENPLAAGEGVRRYTVNSLFDTIQNVLDIIDDEDDFSL